MSQYEGLTHGHIGLPASHGESLFWAGSANSTPPAARTAVNSWYNENGQYSFAKPGFSPRTANFTQLVWKASTTVGVARVCGRGAQWY